MQHYMAALRLDTESLTNMGRLSGRAIDQLWQEIAMRRWASDMHVFANSMTLGLLADNSAS